MSVEAMLVGSLPGTTKSVRTHIRRGRQIAEAIGGRWGVKASDPRAWQCKHVRWYLVVWTKQKALSAKTRYDHWCTIKKLLGAMERLQDWEPQLMGEWICPDGVSRRNGAGSPAGRPMKLPTCAK